MEARPQSEQRFRRESRTPSLAEAPSELLTRLESQAAESGRLSGCVQTLERELEEERAARRRVTEMIQRERRAARALHERAEQERATHSSAAEELERLQRAVAASEQQLQMTTARLRQAEQQLAVGERPFWRKLLRRPPSA